MDACRGSYARTTLRCVRVPVLPGGPLAKSSDPSPPVSHAVGWGAHGVLLLARSATPGPDPSRAVATGTSYADKGDPARPRRRDTSRTPGNRPPDSHESPHRRGA